MPKSKRSPKRRAKLQKKHDKTLKWARRRYRRYIEEIIRRSAPDA